MQSTMKNWQHGFGIAFNTALFTVLSINLAVADIWVEQGDAPGLIGQETIGSGPLDRIDGTIFNPDFNPDLYCITIDDPANFSATAVGSSIGDLSLWLFDENYFGVTHDGADDFANGPNSGYQASLSNAFLFNGPGVYYLGVSRGGVDALGFMTPDLEIWLDNPTVESNPTGPGAFNHLEGWTSPGYGIGGAYSISLTGATFHTTTVPEPTTAGLSLSLLIWGCATTRRRRER